MIDTIPRPDAGLPEFLAARARHSSDARLALDTSLGFIVAAVAVSWGFPGWHVVLSAASCFFAFGVWGIADRELGERGASASRVAVNVLRGAQALSAIIGALGVATLLLTFMAVALGRIIS
jgi:hypothetical protein